MRNSNAIKFTPKRPSQLHLSVIFRHSRLLRTRSIAKEPVSYPRYRPRPLIAQKDRGVLCKESHKIYTTNSVEKSRCITVLRMFYLVSLQVLHSEDLNRSLFLSLSLRREKKDQSPFTFRTYRRRNSLTRFNVEGIGPNGPVRLGDVEVCHDHLRIVMTGSSVPRGRRDSRDFNLYDVVPR